MNGCFLRVFPISFSRVFEQYISIFHIAWVHLANQIFRCSYMGPKISFFSYVCNEILKKFIEIQVFFDYYFFQFHMLFNLYCPLSLSEKYWHTLLGHPVVWIEFIEKIPYLVIIKLNQILLVIPKMLYIQYSEENNVRNPWHGRCTTNNILNRLLNQAQLIKCTNRDTSSKNKNFFE